MNAAPATLEPQSSASPARTVADLIDRLGGVPAERILMDPPPGTATEIDLLRWENAPERRLCELVEGTLVELPMAYFESEIAMELGHRILTHLNAQGNRRIGRVTGGDGSMRLADRLVRRPDVAFTSRQRTAESRRLMQPIADAVPEWAVEVPSASNTVAEMDRKRREYFAGGALLVWLVEWRDRSVTVFDRPAEPDAGMRRTDSEVLTGTPVLPEFSVGVAEIFECLDSLD